MSFFDISALLGGLAIFMHGLSLTREGLQLIAGDKLRAIVFALSKNRIIALFSGIFVTLILQSASAATVMVAGFASSGGVPVVRTHNSIMTSERRKNTSDAGATVVNRRKK